MEAKLKALKVADLKEILTKSGTPIGSKANKADLIAKILATPAALEIAGGDAAVAPAAPAEAETKVDDDLLAPPDEFDWDGGAGGKTEPATTEPEATPAIEEPAAVTEPAQADAVAEPPTEAAAADPAPASTDAAAAPPAAAVDDDVARRKARAERFGVPFVENPAPASGPRPARQKGKANATTVEGAKKGDGGKKADGGKKPEGAKKEGAKKAEEVKKDPKPPKISAKEAAPNDDDAKLAARAARFGISGPAAGASATPADPAEDDKKKKREARFGAPTAKKAKTDA